MTMRGPDSNSDKQGSEVPDAVDVRDVVQGPVAPDVVAVSVQGPDVPDAVDVPELVQAPVVPDRLAASAKSYQDFEIDEIIECLMTTQIFQGSLEPSKLDQVIQKLSDIGFAHPLGMEYNETPDGPIPANPALRPLLKEWWSKANPLELRDWWSRANLGRCEYYFPDYIAFTRNDLDGNGALVGLFEAVEANDWTWTLIYASRSS